MGQIVNMWIFVFLIAGSIIFFVVRFSGLARRHGKNRLVFGFIGAGSFLLMMRMLGYIAELLDVAKGYVPSYVAIIGGASLCWGLYVWLRTAWAKQNS